MRNNDKIIGYDEFFEQCTGFKPRTFQKDIGTSSLKEEINAPTGAGKTAAIIVKFLWDLYRKKNYRKKLVFILPMRTLTTQVSEEARRMVKNCSKFFNKEDRPLISTLMGGDNDTDFLLKADRPWIIVGVADIALSMFVACYGSTKVRNMYTGFFAHDTWAVLDEVQLLPYGGTTMKLLRETYRNVTPVSGRPNFFTIMSATGENTYEGETTDLMANRKEFCLNSFDNSIQIVSETEGKRLIVVNTVAESQRITRLLLDSPTVVNNSVKILCLHSRFTERDKKRILREYNECDNVIMVATQVIEAGVDITSSVLVSEPAPMASIVQRAGRLGRRGEENTKFILLDYQYDNENKPLPYDLDDVDKAQNFYAQQINGEMLSASEICKLSPVEALPWVSGNDDVEMVSKELKLLHSFQDTFMKNIRSYDNSVVMEYESFSEPRRFPYVRGNIPVSVRLIYSDNVSFPDRSFLVMVKLNSVVLQSDDLEEWDGTNWVKVVSSGKDRVNPNNTYRLPESHWGYSSVLGFTDDEDDVPDCSIVYPKTYSNKFSNRRINDRNVSRIYTSGVISLEKHSDDTKLKAFSIVSDWENELFAETVIDAARLHDIGKVSKDWQSYIRGLSSDVDSDVLLAKSYNPAGLVVSSGFASAGPRHEYLSGLMILSDPIRYLGVDSVSDASYVDVVTWLVMSHHGNMKFSVPERSNSNKIFGVEISAAPTMLSNIVENVSGDSDVYLLDKRTKSSVRKSAFRRNVPDKYEYPKVFVELLERLDVSSLEKYIVLLSLSAAVRSADWEASSTYV